ncbi:JmjC domain-containing protein [Citrus sinensis]|uniref:JmjC domain-containing protein n=1 Tax=Citrus sinensis TaxID=2711 RepID=A0ACB8LS81_CITSI|nr:JmjC domain-containing protein [Citrus sinensis]
MGIRIGGGQIEKLNGKEVSYSEFVEKYMAKNQPVVLTGLMDDWRACKDWVTENGQPNLLFFSTHFGKSKVQVADCGIREFTDQKRVEMSVSEFVKNWLENSIMENSNASTNEANDKSVLYLKDWHFAKEYPEYVAYRTPLIFCDDWLNMYLDHFRLHKDPESYQKDNDICCSDYRFVYMGAKGSWTPLHADVFRSYSWSANVCGKKKWLFLSPSQCHLVFDRNLKGCVYNIFDDVSETDFPGFKKTIWLECTQEQNEIIFVPSGWYHQVHNLEDTISINHNWFNGYNLSWVWDLLLRDYNEAKEYIEDIRDICDDFEGLCQRNLAANTGMNFYDFFSFISRFSLVNVVILFHLRRDYENQIWSSSPVARHLALNLVSIRKIALKMKSVNDVAGSFGFFMDLKETLDDPKFLKLCMGFCRTYGMIHEEEKWTCEIKKALMLDFEDYDSLISSPEDLVKFIDFAAGKFSGNCSEENILLSRLEDG